MSGFALLGGVGHASLWIVNRAAGSLVCAIVGFVVVRSGFCLRDTPDAHPYISQDERAQREVGPQSRAGLPCNKSSVPDTFAVASITRSIGFFTISYFTMAGWHGFFSWFYTYLAECVTSTSKQRRLHHAPFIALTVCICWRDVE
jgi:hypothetical protein